MFQIKKGKKNGGDRVRLTFGSMYDRDLLMSHAVNLPENSSVELVIPDHLQSLKRYLDRFAYQVRNRARAVSYTHLTLPTIYSV